MSDESKYKLNKKIKELEQRNAKLEDDLYCYRQTVLEIFAGIEDVLNKNSNGIACGWILSKIRRCLK